MAYLERSSYGQNIDRFIVTSKAFGIELTCEHLKLVECVPMVSVCHTLFNDRLALMQGAGLALIAHEQGLTCK